MVAAVVPIKAFDSAKSRLAPRLNPAQRAALARASAGRVLAAVAATPGITLWIAVVEDEVSADFARRHRFEVLLRPDVWGQSAAVEAGFELARNRGAHTLLTLSADVPLARSVDVAELLVGDGPVLVMASDRLGVGTNALRLSPAGAFRLHFGADSLRKHRQEAAEAKLPVRIVGNRRLRLDVDTADDLDALEKSGPEGRRLIIDAGQLHLDATKVEREDSPGWASEAG